MKKTSQLPVQLTPSEHTLICSLAREFWQSNEPVLWLVDGRWLHGRRFMAQAKAAADAAEPVETVEAPAERLPFPDAAFAFSLTSGLKSSAI